MRSLVERASLEEATLMQNKCICVFCGALLMY